MGYLELAAVAGLGGSGAGLSSSPLAPVLMALALCAFGAAVSLLLRGRKEQRRHEAGLDDEADGELRAQKVPVESERL